MDFRFGARPFPAFQGLHREFDHEPVRRNTPRFGLFFDLFPLSWREADVLLCRLHHPFYRPLRDVRLFPSAVKSIYLIDISMTSSLFPYSFGTCIPQHVIKTKADSLKLLRTQAGPCRTALRNPARNDLIVFIL